MRLINVNEFEIQAQAVLSHSVYDYIASGAGDEFTLKKNLVAFRNIGIKPRVLRGVNQVCTDITLLNQKLSQPIFVAPMAFHALAHALGELATVQATNDANIGMCVSTMSSTKLEEVADVATCPLWFQLYVYKDRTITLELIQRAELAGYQALVITVDVPIMGRREKDIRNKFGLPVNVSAKNFSNPMPVYSCNDQISATLKTYTDAQFDSSLTWHDIEWIQEQTTLPILLKGIVHEDDARIARDMNVDAIVISNHGGRQLDDMPATMQVLPIIAEVVQGAIPILIDGGFRRGTDIFKAIALGADCILIGRPVLWALAVNGSDGLKAMLNMYLTELQETMILCGCSTIDDIKTNGSKILHFDC